MKAGCLKILSVAFVFVFVLGAFVYAREGSRRGDAIARVLVFESLSEKEKKELIELRKTDKKQFRTILKEKLIAKKQELEHLKKTDPEKFKALLAKARATIKERLAELKKNNPKKYEELMAKRKEHIKARLEYLKKTDPQKYEELKKIIQGHRAPLPAENNL